MVRAVLKCILNKSCHIKHLDMISFNLPHYYHRSSGRKQDVPSEHLHHHQVFRICSNWSKRHHLVDVEPIFQPQPGTCCVLLAVVAYIPKHKR